MCLAIAVLFGVVFACKDLCSIAVSEFVAYCDSIRTARLALYRRSIVHSTPVDLRKPWKLQEYLVHESLPYGKFCNRLHLPS